MMSAVAEADFNNDGRLDKAVVTNPTTITVNLKNLYGANLDTLFEQDAQLIGGMRIRVGSDVYDNSVKARLAAIEGRL